LFCGFVHVVLVALFSSQVGLPSAVDDAGSRRWFCGVFYGTGLVSCSLWLLLESSVGLVVSADPMVVGAICSGRFGFCWCLLFIENSSGGCCI
jgi:hypothetical protein